MKHKNVDLSSPQIGFMISLLKEYLERTRDLKFDPIGTVQHFEDPGDPIQPRNRERAEDLLKHLEPEQESFRPKRP